MKGNRNNGMGLLTAVQKLSALWNDLKMCYPEIAGTTIDDEFKRCVSWMRKRIKAEGELK